LVTLAANLSMMFTDLPFLERFGAAADAGFRTVEFIFPYASSTIDVAEAAQTNRLEVALFNTPSGNWEGGERGIACHPDRVGEFRDGLEQALDYAQALGCAKLHVMAGKAEGLDRDEAAATLVDNLRFAGTFLAPHDIDVLVEPINTRVDMPGYFLDTTAAAVAILDAVGLENVLLQYDIYHMQIMEGDLARTIERLLPRIGHIQLADNPGRHEPGTGEIDYPWLLNRIDALGYKGAIGCEYRPLGDTRAGLGWATPYLVDYLARASLGDKQ
jgi:hydroxypyruvate isomerase